MARYTSAMPQSEPYQFSVAIGTAGCRQSRTFVDLAEKLKMDVVDLMRQEICGQEICGQEDVKKLILRDRPIFSWKKITSGWVLSDCQGSGIHFLSKAKPQ